MFVYIITNLEPVWIAIDDELYIGPTSNALYPVGTIKFIELVGWFEINPSEINKEPVSWTSCSNGFK